MVSALSMQRVKKDRPVLFVKLRFFRLDSRKFTTLQAPVREGRPEQSARRRTGALESQSHDEENRAVRKNLM